MTIMIKSQLRTLSVLITGLCLSFLPCFHLAAGTTPKEVNIPTPQANKTPKGQPFFGAQTFTLDNGLTVYLIESHRTPVVGISIIYRVGSADDPRGKSGLAHFLEHMMFKGTKGSSAERLMKDAEALGGKVNAYTSFDETVYYEVIPKAHCEKFLRYEADRMTRIEARPEDVTPEINVVLEEENMRMGNNHFAPFMSALRRTFFTHHPYGTVPIGYRNEIKSYTSQDVKTFHTQHYGPNNAFVVLSGDLTLAEATTLMKKYFAPIPRRGGWATADRGRVIEPPLTYTATLTQTSNRVSEPYMARFLKAPEPSRDNDRTFNALDLGFYALSNPATGILYRRLVEDIKAAQSFALGIDPHTISQGHISLIAQTAPGTKMADLERFIQKELKRILDKGLTDQQLKLYKQALLVKGDYMKDSLLGGGDHIINPLIANRPLEAIEHWQDTLMSLTADEINKALRTYLQQEYHVVGYLNPAPPQKDSMTENPHINVITKPKTHKTPKTVKPLGKEVRHAR